MPFTPFHLGPALFIGIPLRKYLNLPTFLIANIIIDIEPLLVLTYNIYGYPLHGLLHTYLSALITGSILGLILYKLRNILNPVWRLLRLEEKPGQEPMKYIYAGVSGIALHILLDSPLYPDIKPLYPTTLKPLYNPTLSPNIYTLCIILGLIGLINYILLIKKG